MKNANNNTHGYFHITISSRHERRLMHSNNERAFIISQLQDLLSPRMLIGDLPPYWQLASCIDLLAFSITAEKISLIVFGIDNKIISNFASRLGMRLSQYQCEFEQTKFQHGFGLCTSVKRLSGAHSALVLSVQTHLQHQDWEYDRYSSVGFYLHDRRGDWMRTWRLSRLYKNNSEIYRSMINATLPKTEHLDELNSTAPAFAP